MQLNQVSQYPVITPLPESDVPGPINKLHSDPLAVVLANANEPSLSAAKLVSKKWNEMIVNSHAYPDLCSQLKNKVAFGPEDWAKCMGIRLSDEDIQAAYAILPDNIEQILNSPCPVSPESGKLVKDTHLLVYIPASLKGKDLKNEAKKDITKPITLKALGELIEGRLSKEGNSRKVAGYGYVWKKGFKQLDKPVEEAHWVLMTKDVLGGMDTGPTGSRGKDFVAQKKMVEELAERSGEAYMVPQTMEAVAVIISNFLRTNERLFADGERLWTFTRCQENIRGDQMVVGGFAPAGLCVFLNYDRDDNGVAGLRKFVF